MKFAEAEALMAVTVPEGTSGDVAVKRFEIKEAEARFANLRMAINGARDRYVQPGTYTSLTRRGTLWMSDTPAERHDHSPFVVTCDRTRAERVLVTGLGLGMVAAALVHVPSVREIDIVEIDADVVALVGEHVVRLGKDHGVEVRVHQGDATRPGDVFGRTGRRWSAAWHDIWPTISPDDYEDHKRVRRAYQARVGWQDVWQGNEVRRMVRRDRESRSGWPY